MPKLETSSTALCGRRDRVRVRPKLARSSLLLGCLCGYLWAGNAFAAPPVMSTQSTDDATVQTDSNSAVSSGPFGFVNGISRSSQMLGDMWGLRPWLGRAGITFQLQETSEYLGNVTGGSRKGFAYDGLTTATVQMDTQRAFGLYGGTFNVSALQLHGTNLSSRNLQTLQTASGIESDPSTRLWELWYQQKFLEGKMDVKIGQQSLDQEFMVSQNALLFVNTMFGWPMLPSADMPGGGPAYPLSAPGVRLRFKPADSWTVLVGVFSGSPVKNDDGSDPQKQNRSGTSFPLNNGALAIAEVQFAYPSLGTMLYADQPEPLSGTYKLGIWYDTEKFADLRYGTDGLSLADPNSNGVGIPHRGNYAVYGVIDQMLWQQASEPDRTINGFVRVMYTPLKDRNLIDFSANVGLTMHEPFLHRDDDTFGIGLGYAHVSHQAAGLDQDTSVFTGTYTPVRTSETFLEATYQYAITPWWQLQADIQYVFHPGAGVLNQYNGVDPVKNELVIGLRTNIAF